ncbi:hypothetical protein CLCR_02604 [Cladophialophora carrionii]|uniref:Uncharacterized protein n=1 Tax=Cladophialophora carrionii TaxID=86049 RepID=A0A1C1CEP5_9EURO|nr:hypothetical protein CLCR_02604 [Cladophialophora carrionii]
MSHTPSPTDSTSTSATSTHSTPGVLWTTACIQRKDLPLSLFDAWYDEHINICLSCPGNGGLFLRYKNIDPQADVYAVPNWNEEPSHNDTATAKPTTWPFLALVKLDDIKWVASKQFNDMSRFWKLLPPEPDGSIGSAFSCFYGALRCYETVRTVPDPTGRTTRPKYILSVQTTRGASSAAADDDWDAQDQEYVGRPGFRCAVRYRLVEDLLAAQEPGWLPKGLALYEFDGEEPPRVAVGQDCFKADVWEFILEAGDSSLRL